jgi:hypothetical protein
MNESKSKGRDRRTIFEKEWNWTKDFAANGVTGKTFAETTGMNQQNTNWMKKKKRNVKKQHHVNISMIGFRKNDSS